MRRDPDVIRKLLLDMEASDHWLFVVDAEGGDGSEPEYHLHLLMDEGLVTWQGKYAYRMTAAGHDFVEAIRNDTVWNRTKEAAANVGGVTLGFLGEIAKGYIRSELVKYGVPLA